MKFLSLITALLLTLTTTAQSPEGFTYQSVIRNASNELIQNATVGVQVSILQGDVNGSSVYSETHSPTTNINGLFTIVVGEGTSNDDFTAINWSDGPFFIKSEVDPNGGTDYTISGTTQLLSVPYALHASVADSIVGGVQEVDGSVTNEIQTLSKSGNTVTLSNNGGSFTDSVNTFVAGNGIEISNDTIRLSNNNGRVIRDFLTWSTTQNNTLPIHIKTNITYGTHTMYRILIEGYSYSSQKAINSDAVGYMYTGPQTLLNTGVNNYSAGATLTQYVSTDNYLVLKLTPANSNYYIGFSASAWFVNPYGKMDIQAEVFLSDTDL